MRDKGEMYVCARHTSVYKHRALRFFSIPVVNVASISLFFFLFKSSLGGKRVGGPEGVEYTSIQNMISKYPQ